MFSTRPLVYLRGTVKALTEIAESGKQVILFTCHEHISRIFQKLDVPVRILPRFEDPTKTVRVLLPASMVKQRQAEKPPIDESEYTWNEFGDSSTPEDEDQNDPFVQEFFE